MPLYDYQCAECKEVFEIRLSFSEVDTAQPPCVKCGSTHTQRRLDAKSLLIKSAKSGYRLNSEDFNNAVGLAQAAGGEQHETSDSHHHSHDHHDHAH